VLKDSDRPAAPARDSSRSKCVSSNVLGVS
jgi:hypothetical protein